MTSTARDELAALRTQNQRLKLALATIVGVAIGAAGIGMTTANSATNSATTNAATAAAPAPVNPLVSITTDGTYLYRMYQNGTVHRLDIETREDENKTRPDVFYTRPINQWNLFVPKQ